jgi:hypothetical protein
MRREEWWGEEERERERERETEREMPGAEKREVLRAGRRSPSVGGGHPERCQDCGIGLTNVGVTTMMALWFGRATSRDYGRRVCINSPFLEC